MMRCLATGILNVPLAGILFPSQAVLPALYSGEHSIKGTLKHTSRECVCVKAFVLSSSYSGTTRASTHVGPRTTSFAGSELVNRALCYFATTKISYNTPDCRESLFNFRQFLGRSHYFTPCLEYTLNPRPIIAIAWADGNP